MEYFKKRKVEYYMNIPKLIFKEMSLEENIEIVKWTFYDKGNGILSLHEFTLKCFPELRKLSFNMSKEDIDKTIEEVVSKNYNLSIENIRNEVDRYNKIWENYNDIYFETLTNYFEVDFPDYITKIVAGVGLIPVFPRDIDSFSFDIGTNLSKEKVIQVCAHETLHFIWFEKWKQLHPKTPREEFNTPYLVWKYSEMVTDPVLNNKPFSDKFNFQEKSYDEFYELYDGDELVMDKLRNIFSEDISLSDKINKGFEYIKKMENMEFTRK